MNTNVILLCFFGFASATFQKTPQEFAQSNRPAFGTIGGRLFMCLPPAYPYHLNRSPLYVYNESNSVSPFVPFQKLPGITEIEFCTFFTMRGETYLGVAVPLTRVGHQKTDDTSPFANSSIFKWNATANKFAGPIQLIPSEGGCDFTYFEIDGDSFVFVSNSFRPYFKVYNNATTTQVFPEVLKWSSAAGQFVHHQYVMTSGTEKSIFVSLSPS